MADHHDEDAPDVDYEGEEDDDDDEPQQLVVEVAEVINKPSGSGDSETDDDDDDGPRPKAGSKAVDEKGAGDSETESEGEVAATDNKVPPPQQPNDKSAKEDQVGASRGYHQQDTSKIMDRALSAPREKTNNNNHDQQQQRGDGRGERGSRWGERNHNNNINRGALKRPEQEEGVGVYIPPAKRRLLEEQRKAQEAASTAAAAASSNNDTGEGKESIKKQITPINKQRQSWENLQRTINGTINRLSPSTIKPLIHSLFSEANLVKGRGILAKSILKASSASPQFTPTYASLMAVINTKLPECGELLVTRCILSFRKHYRYRNRNEVTSILSLLGHLFNQGLAHELLSLQILTVLLDGDPTDDSVDVAVGYMCIVGRQLCEVSPTGVHAVMERFRGLLHEGSIGRRGQYRIETLLKIKKGGFKDYPIIPDEEHLDLVEREDQITFELGLDDEDLKNEESLDNFSFDEEYDEKEEEWKKIKAEILGEDSESGSGSDGDSESGSDDDEEEEVPDQQLEDAGDKKKTVVIEDLTETDLVHLRRTIYLTIMSSATFEECTHKLAKMDIPPGRECELINMIIECCSQERTFLRYYGLVSGRFCLLHERWQTAFEEAFATQYNTIHRLETNKLRNVAKLFGHLLHTDSVSWSVLGCIHLNEDETTSSSRIFIKILVQEMAEAMGMVTLKQRFDTDNPEPDGAIGEDAAASTTALAVSNGGRHQQQQQHETSSREWFKGMFPKDNARNTRYAINFFTSIGLGPLTDGMREFLKNAPKLILAQAQAAAAREAAAAQKDDDESSVISSSSSDTSSASSSSSGSSSTSSSSFSSSSSSSYSSDSRYRRKKSSGRDRGRGRKRGRSSRSRSYSSSSSSSSGSDSSRGGRKKKYSSKTKRSRRSNSRDTRDSGNEGASKATTPSNGSKRRSVSESPTPARRGGRRRRSYSSSRSHSRSPGGDGGSKKRRGSSGDDRRSRKSPPEEVDKSKLQQKEERVTQKKRGRSSSYSSSSRSRSPPVRKESLKRSKDGGGRKRSRRARRSDSRSVSSGRK